MNVYWLARWLMRNEHDAEDVVQEASLRAPAFQGRQIVVNRTHARCLGETRRDVPGPIRLTEATWTFQFRSGAFHFI